MDNTRKWKHLFPLWSSTNISTNLVIPCPKLALIKSRNFLTRCSNGDRFCLRVLLTLIYRLRVFCIILTETILWAPARSSTIAICTRVVYRFLFALVNACKFVNQFCIPELWHLTSVIRATVTTQRLLVVKYRLFFDGEIIRKEAQGRRSSLPPKCVGQQNNCRGTTIFRRWQKPGLVLRRIPRCCQSW